MLWSEIWIEREKVDPVRERQVYRCFWHAPHHMVHFNISIISSLRGSPEKSVPQKMSEIWAWRPPSPSYRCCSVADCPGLILQHVLVHKDYRATKYSAISSQILCTSPKVPLSLLWVGKLLEGDLLNAFGQRTHSSFLWCESHVRQTSPFWGKMCSVGKKQTG